MALLGFGTSYAWIFFFSGLSGLGQGGFHPEGFKTVNVIGGEKKASAISLFLVGGSLGVSVGPLMATLFFKYLGLKGSVLFLPLGILMAVIFMVTPYWKAKTEHFANKGRGLKLSDSFRGRTLPIALLVLVVVLRSATQLSLQTFIPFYFINILHRDPLVVGQYLSTFLLVGTFGSLVGGPLADRYGYRRTVLSCLIFSPIFLYFFFYTDGLKSLIFFALAGLFLNAPHAVNMAMGQAYMPQNLGMASGLILGLAMGIGGIGTTILGWIADQWSLYATLHITFALPLLAFLLFSFIPYPPKH
jgi:FSR family fosmidomycin resistance protein-like MFS transporter